MFLPCGLYLSSNRMSDRPPYQDPFREPINSNFALNSPEKEVPANFPFIFSEKRFTQNPQ